MALEQPKILKGIEELNDKSVDQEVNIEEKVKLNSEAANVNFKRNEIVQDGLVKIVPERNLGVIDMASITVSPENVILFYYNRVDDNEARLCNMYSSGNYLCSVTANKNALSIATNDGSATFAYINFDNIVSGSNTIYIWFSGDDMYCYVNGVTKSVKKPSSYTITNFTIGRSVAQTTVNRQTTLVYKRILTQAEINHNLSVLNNSPSISAIETTDSSSVKTSFLISSDSEHVEMPNGKTLRDFAYEALDWETKTSDGSDISVTNGKEAWVRKAKISGNTIKNYAKTYIREFTADGSTWIGYGTEIDVSQIKLSTKYYLHCFIYINELSGDFMVSNAENSIVTPNAYVEKGKTGYFKFEVTSLSNLGTKKSVWSQVKTNTQTGKIKYAVALTDSDVDLSNAFKEPSLIHFGLTSTQAILSNNGVSYSYYVTETDKVNGKIIESGGVDTVRDTLEQLEDGSGIYTQNTYLATFDGSTDESWAYAGTQYDKTNTLLFWTYSKFIPVAVSTGTDGKLCAICDKLNSITASLNLNTDVESVACFSTVRIRVNKSNLSTQDSAGFYAWLKSNPITVRYQLAAPIVTYIPKELMPVITTEQSNLISSPSPVKPNEIEVTVAVDKVSDLEARLTQLEGIVTSTSNLSLQANYAEDEYNNLINQL